MALQLCLGTIGTNLAFAIASSKTSPIKLQPSPVSLSGQRYIYSMAKSSLAKGEWQEFKNYYAQLGDYPLVPYLDYSILKYQLPSLPIEKVDSFLHKHKDSFLETRLREQLLYTLAIKRRWEDYLRYYTPAMAHSVELKCYQLYSRIKQRDESAWQEITEVWTVGRSLPKDCELLFNRWKKKGGLTQEVAWKRFNAAMENNKRGLSRYVTSFMEDKYRSYAELYMRVDRYPYSIRKHRLFSEQSLPMQQVIAHGIKRYARLKPKDALYHWELYEAQQLFPLELSTDTKRYIVKKLVQKGYVAEAEKMIRHSQELRSHEVLAGFIRESLKEQQWEKVLQWTNLLDGEQQLSDRWLYWRARALSELGIGIHDEVLGTPEEIYRQLAKKRSFYGFMSADLLNKNYSLEYLPAEVKPSTLVTVENHPVMRRVKELWFTGNIDEARAEWEFATKDMKANELIAAGQLAREWGWYNKGIRAMISGNLWDYLDLRFPLAYRDVISKISSTTHVETTLIYAIARQESAFSAKATSSAGAMGLMQLMPRTAQQTAGKKGIKHRKKDLFKPEHNMTLGSHYLNELLERYDGNRILAAAAYNAGPHRVKRWTQNTPEDLPFDIWIEIIPFKETRGYVQNVLSFSVIYGYRLGKPSTLLTASEAKSLL